ncbi:MAG: hypothetical protein R3F61_11975 [Myxococcota bacterium]
MRPAVRSVLVFAVGWAALCALLFLFLAGFFTAWNGVAVSVRDGDPEQAVYSVLIVEDDGTRFEADWPAHAVQGLKLSIDSLALPPKPLPEGLPRTEKQRWSTSFTVTPAEGEARSVGTTKPQALAIALLVFVIGLGGRNMMVAGSPLSIEPTGITLPKAQRPPGQAASPDAGGGGGTTSRASRPQKGPPPGKRRRGGGRRR